MFYLSHRRTGTCCQLSAYLHMVAVRTACSLLQGVLAPADAQLAVRAGVDGIILRYANVSRDLRKDKGACRVGVRIARKSA